jgi:phosphate transport system substrate-binding protein
MIHRFVSPPPSRRQGLAIRGLIGAVFAIVPAAQPGRAQSRDGLDVQRVEYAARAVKAKEVYPPRKWNIDYLPHYAPEQKVSGTLRIWGLNYIWEGGLMKAWEDGFHRYQPGVSFDYHMKYSSLTSIGALYTGVADLAPCRKINFYELEGFQRVFSHDPTEVSMGGSYDIGGWGPAVVFFVNVKNPLTKVTMRQLDGIFGAERKGGYQGTTWHPEVARGPEGNIRTWGQLGLTGEWRDKPINVYGPNNYYDTHWDIQRRVFQGGDKWNEKIREYTNYANADGSFHLGWKEFLAEIGARDPYGIAYAFMWAIQPGTKPLAVAAQDGGPYVQPTVETCQDRTYPMYGDNYWYLNREPGKPVDPKVKEYLRYVLSREGEQDLLDNGRLLPLPAAVAEEQLRKLE